MKLVKILKEINEPDSIEGIEDTLRISTNMSYRKAYKFIHLLRYSQGTKEWMQNFVKYENDQMTDRSEVENFYDDTVSFMTALKEMINKI